MSSYKRSKVSFDKEDYYNQSSSSSSGSGKRARTKPPRKEDSTEFEIDHESMLEPAKRRRGAVAKDAYVSDDEEVGGGTFSSDSEDEDDNVNNGKEDGGKGKGKKVQDDDDDFDMFSTTMDTNNNEEEGASKNTMSNKKKKLALQDIEGQEMSSKDQESDDEDDNEQDDDSKKKKEPKLMAFNMKQEMEEGSFDAQGNYIRNEKDPEAFHDRWMEGISRKEMIKAKEAQFKRDQMEKVKEATRQSTLPQTEGDVYKILIDYLLPGETVQEALTTLGKGAHGKIPAWKQKLLDKKNKNKKQPQQPVDDQQALEKQKKVEKITELADQLMALGHFNVYEDTFEYIVRYLRSKLIVEEDWIPQSKERK
ncbi:hypothetical protein BJ944DRAFT_259666 [Cunninghamella echinulata]|nr:hypothetical protein BJ944DRAFT_259666 [Cunninghamella echinulata]